MQEQGGVADASGAVQGRRVGAVELGEDGGRLVADFGEDQPGHGALRAGATSLDGAVGAAEVEQAHGLVVGDVATDAHGAALEPPGVGVDRLSSEESTVGKEGGRKSKSRW